MKGNAPKQQFELFDDHTLDQRLWGNESLRSFLSAGDFDPAKLLRIGEVLQLGKDIDTFSNLWYNIFFYVCFL